MRMGADASTRADNACGSSDRAAEARRESSVAWDETSEPFDSAGAEV